MVAVAFSSGSHSRGAAPGARVPVVAKIDYLVCTTEICVPETQTLMRVLTIGDGAVDPAVRARFDAWRRAIPKPLGARAIWQATDGAWRMAVPWPASQPAGGAWFYPAAAGTIDMAAPQTGFQFGPTSTENNMQS